MGTRDFRSQLLAQGLAPRSVREYVRAAATAEAWFEAQGYELVTATPSQAAEYLEARPKTFASRNLMRAALGHYWRVFGHPDPPLAAVRVPPKPRMVCRAVEPEDAKLLAKAARHRGDAKGLAVAIGLYLGLRREEIATLRWSAFDASGWVTVMGKGERSRTIPVHPALRELLAAHPRNGPYIFPGRLGGHVCNATIWDWSLQVAEEAGLGHIPTHVLRHTCLATGNDNTADLRSVQEYAGHADPSVTAGYTRATKRRLTAVMESLDY